MITPTQIGVIERMVVYMSDRCNGATTQDKQGWNRLDVNLGHKLADQVRQGKSFTFAQRAAAHKMLRKYAKQLSQGGFDIAGVPVPDATAPGVEAKVGGVCFVCGQTWEPGSLIRFAPDKRRYHADCEPVEGTPLSRADQQREQAAVETREDVIVPEQIEHLAAIRDEDVVGSRELTADEMVEFATRFHGLDEYQRLYGDDDFPPNLPSPVETKTRTGKTVRELLGPNGPIAAKLSGYEQRDEQIEVAQAMEDAIQRRQHIVAEAGTGVGKSFCYMSAGYNSGKKTIVSTNTKSLQGQLWLKDTPFLQGALGEFSAAIMKGRTNYLCLRDYATLDAEIGGGLFGVESEGWQDKDSVEAWPKLQEWAIDTQDGDIDTCEGITTELRQKVTTDSDGCVGRKCPFFSQCWIEKAKDRSETADVVIVNHALLMRDRRMRMEIGHALLPNADVIVIDESHNLEEQATDAFADELTQYGWRQLMGRIESMSRHHKGLNQDQQAVAENYGIHIDAIDNAIRDVLKEIANRFVADAEGHKPSHIMIGALHGLADVVAEPMQNLVDYMKDTPVWLTEDKDRELWRKARRRLSELWRKWYRALHAPDESDGFVRYAELRHGRNASYVILNVKPIEVADILRRSLFSPAVYNAATADDIDDDWVDDSVDLERPTVVCTSATIAVGEGMSAWRKRVGMDDAVELIVDSPFDYRRNAVLYIPHPDRGFTPAYRGDAATQYQRQISDEMLALVQASKGRAFLLFTSNRMMNYVYDEIGFELSQDYQVLKQGMAGISRPKLVEMFKQEPSVLFGVSSFWEGVDCPGDVLSLVVIDKMPFTPPDDPIWSERERVVKDRGGNAFMELQIPFATIKLKQAFGRLVRSKTDRGAVAILDARLRTKFYGRTVIDSLPPARRSEKLKNIEALFEGRR